MIELAATKVDHCLPFFLFLSSLFFFLSDTQQVRKLRSENWDKINFELIFMRESKQADWIEQTCLIQVISQSVSSKFSVSDFFSFQCIITTFNQFALSLSWKLPGKRKGTNLQSTKGKNFNCFPFCCWFGRFCSCCLVRFKVAAKISKRNYRQFSATAADAADWIAFVLIFCQYLLTCLFSLLLTQCIIYCACIYWMNIAQQVLQVRLDSVRLIWW